MCLSTCDISEHISINFVLEVYTRIRRVTFISVRVSQNINPIYMKLETNVVDFITDSNLYNRLLHDKF
jgi:hypothetical protein